MLVAYMTSFYRRWFRIVTKLQISQNSKDWNIRINPSVISISSVLGTDLQFTDGFARISNLNTLRVAFREKITCTADRPALVVSQRRGTRNNRIFHRADHRSCLRTRSPCSSSGLCWKCGCRAARQRIWNIWNVQSLVKAVAVGTQTNFEHFY